MLSLVLSLLTVTAVQAQHDDVIRVNQVAFYPQQQKIAVVEQAAKKGHVSIRNQQTGKVVGQARFVRISQSPWSKKHRMVVDFSQLTAPGRYTLEYQGHTVPVEIHEQALQSVTAGAIKALTLNRSGMAIEGAWAGQWARPLGHPDTLVYIHPSAVSPGRPAGSTISSPYGWYDAGDFNKYIVNSAFSVGIMLYSYEQNPGYYQQLKVELPEQNNQTADLLDELMYNLKWMLTMQDPYDGGVYHKLTTPNFEGFIMPVDARQKRYVVQKTVTASYDFAAVMAQAARIYEGNPDYPYFAAHARRAALAAYHWAEQHPDAYYRQNEMNQRFQPAVTTGEYGDGYALDERFWAATELYRLTADPLFRETASGLVPQVFTLPSWGGVSALGIFGWLAEPAEPLAQTCKNLLLSYCDEHIKTLPTSSFHTPMGNTAREYGWGCLAETFCASGVALLYAHRLTGHAVYLQAAQHNMDYILGRNATGYCYVTGFGVKSPMHPHHRISTADGIEQPLPGMLVGGPNPGQQDREISQLNYPSTEPDESYIDHVGSYASNEIAINWNASLIAALGWLDAVQR